MLLAIDTGGVRSGVALARDGAILCKSSWDNVMRQSEQLWPELSMLLDRHGLDLHALSAVGVACGPGRLTGVRIGLAVAKALCMTLRIPLVTVTLFEQVAWNWREVSGLLSILVTTGSDKWSCVTLSSGSSKPTRGEPVISGRDADLRSALAAHLAGSAPRFVGPGALDRRVALESFWPGSVLVPDSPRHHPALEGLVGCSVAKLAAGETTPLERAVPLYC